MKNQTVIKSVEKIYNQLNNVFYAESLISRVRIDIMRPKLRDGTILRKLRALRQDLNNDINYKVIRSGKVDAYHKI